MSSTQRIGFGKKIRLTWLVEALKLRAAGREFHQVRSELEIQITHTNPGEAAIAKVVSNLRQVVFQPVAENLAHLEHGLRLIQENENHTFCVAWGLAITSYSFVASTAETIGRLLKVQSQFTAADMSRRLTERLGERGFVNRVARYNLSSFLDWGVLRCESKKNLYCRGRVEKIQDMEVLAWLMEAVLLASGQNEMACLHTLSSLLLFPFEFDPISATFLANQNPRLQVNRQSLNEEYFSISDFTNSLKSK